MRTDTFSTPLIVLCLVLVAAAGCGTDKQSSYQSSGAQTESVAVAAEPDDGAGAARGDKPKAVVDGRKLKRNAWMTVEVDDEDAIRPTIEEASAYAQSIDGYIARESSHSIEMMVPGEKLDAALKRLEKLGEVTDRNVSVADVTSQYVDLKVRIDNLERTRQRLQLLMQQSNKVEDVLAVEKELSRVTSQLEQLQARMRTMQRQTSYASIHLNVEEEVTPGPVGWVFYGGYKAVKWLFVWD